MKFTIREDYKSLYETYLIINEQEETEYKVVGKKEIDETFEVKTLEGEILASLKLISYFGQTNFEIYCNDIMVSTIGEEINLFKDIFYFDSKGWKLELDKENMIYEITDINDDIVFLLKKPLINERPYYEIDLKHEDNIVGAIVISVIMYIYGGPKAIGEIR